MDSDCGVVSFFCIDHTDGSPNHVLLRSLFELVLGLSLF